MSSCGVIIEEIRRGKHNAVLAGLYAPDGDAAAVERARKRVITVVNGLDETFSCGERDAAVFSTPGRTEIGGNHTDHQHGRVLCGGVDLDMIACAAENGTREIRVASEGYPAFTVSLDELYPKIEEKNTSAALVRGVAARITEMGYVLSGLDVYVSSDIPTGSGISSSAAYEVLMAGILNRFFCGDAITAVELGQIGQYAENEFFGKPCGLMDQVGVALGGIISIDFRDPAVPVAKKTDFDFVATGHTLFIVNTASDHGDLTEDYAGITGEMISVAAYFGKTVLREVSEEDFLADIANVRRACGDRAVLRAMHFFADDRRAADEAEALEKGDFAGFLALVNESGRSSELMLQNAWSVSRPAEQAITLATAIGRKILGGEGAIRVHGGGFAGTVQAFVPNGKAAEFKAEMEKVFGADNCRAMRIRSRGQCVVIE